MQAGGGEGLWPAHNEEVITLIKTNANGITATSTIIFVTGVGVGEDAEADGVVAADLLQHEQRRQL